MTPIQQLMLGVGASKKTYMDDVFNTDVYTGNATARSINNGIDLSGEGGLVWIKVRGTTTDHILSDTVRGSGYYLRSDQNVAQADDSRVTAFNNNGFSISNAGEVNLNNNPVAAWSFRKAPGFFDIVTYTGNGSNRTIAHSLGCKPGMIIVKRLDAADYWNVLHGSLDIDKRLYLDSNSSASSSSSPWWNATEPTSSVFSVGTDSGVNENNGEYVAYLFAGGESTAATARSVDFAGADSDDYLLAPSALLPAGNDSTKFCLETWVKFDDVSGNRLFYSQYASGDSGRTWISNSAGKLEVWQAGTTHMDTPANSIHPNIWYHVAWTYDGTTHRLFLDGVLQDTVAGSSINAITASNPKIGGDVNYELDGQLSNFRVVHGQAVYTSSFRPSKEPLTTTSQGVTGSNCKALLFNNSSVLNNDGALAALTNPDSGTITASTNSPFDDPAAFTFGDSKEGIIKCGSYKGNGSSTGPEINLGWEPQWVLIKSTSISENWAIYDCMRGVYTKSGTNDARIFADSANGESSGEFIQFYSTGFQPASDSWHLNKDGQDYVYMAIRRRDGYVGKPPELGTDVFSTSVGLGSSEPFSFTAGFPVDLFLHKQPESLNNWYTTTRSMGDKYVFTDSADDEDTTNGGITYDSNTQVGFGYSSSWQSWCWKRHAGLDVVAYSGQSGAKTVPHSLNAVPEMMWVKCRTYEDANGWIVYHKGLNGGTNPEQYRIRLNSDVAEDDTNLAWNDTAPTSTHFTLGADRMVNTGSQEYIAMLFASVPGISKVGYYDGNGTNDGSHEITLGFQPRFLIIKCATGSEPWTVFDTTRGFASGSDNYLRLNTNGASSSGDKVDPTSTGFKLMDSSGPWNDSPNKSYIYYAHA